jgi:hypothetical protein
MATALMADPLSGGDPVLDVDATTLAALGRVRDDLLRAQQDRARAFIATLGGAPARLPRARAVLGEGGPDKTEPPALAGADGSSTSSEMRSPCGQHKRT